MRPDLTPVEAVDYPADMAHSMLVLLIADPESQASRCEQGLLFALNAARTDVLDQVCVMLSGDGVRILDNAIDGEGTFATLLEDLRSAGVETVACTGNLGRHQLAQAARNAGVPPAGAQVYVPARIREGFEVVTF